MISSYELLLTPTPVAPLSAGVQSESFVADAMKGIFLETERFDQLLERLQAAGMLIYPKVDRELREHYEILGRKVTLCTVDLQASWQSIAQEIRSLME